MIDGVAADVMKEGQRDERPRLMMPEIIAVARQVRMSGLAIIALGVAASSVTVNWVIDHDQRANFFPEFAGRVVYLSDLFLLAGVAVWAAGWNLYPRRAPTFGPRYVGLPLLLLVVLTALSVVWASDPALAGFATTRRILLLGVYVALVNDAKVAFTPMVAALVVIAVLQVGVAWAQVVTGGSVGLASLGEIPAMFPQYVDVQASGSRIGCPLPTGLGFNPHPLAEFLAAVSALAYGFVLLSPGGWLKRALMLLVYVVALFGVLATGCRQAMGGWATALVVVTGLAWWWTPPARAATVTRFAVAATLAAVAMWLLPVAFPLTADCATRVARYSAREVSGGIGRTAGDLLLAVPIVRDHPWLGVGASNYPLALKTQVAPDAVGPPLVPVHNVTLLLLAELGITGAGCWLLLMTAPLIRARSRWRAGADLHELVWLGPLLSVFVVGLSDFTPWGTQDGRVLTIAVIGMWAGGITAAQHGTMPSSPRSSPREEAVADADWT